MGLEDEFRSRREEATGVKVANIDIVKFAERTPVLVTITPSAYSAGVVVFDHLSLKSTAVAIFPVATCADYFAQRILFPDFENQEHNNNVLEALYKTWGINPGGRDDATLVFPPAGEDESPVLAVSSVMSQQNAVLLALAKCKEWKKKTDGVQLISSFLKDPHNAESIHPEGNVFADEEKVQIPFFYQEVRSAGLEIGVDNIYTDVIIPQIAQQN